MKALTLVFAIITSATAQAMVTDSSGFMPGQCGNQQYTDNAPSFTVDVREVCLGRLYDVQSAFDGVSSEAVSFRMTDGSERVFLVAQKSNLLMALQSGANKSMFHLVGANGERATMSAIQTRDGFVQSVSGQIENVKYFIPEFELMFTIQ